MAIILNLEKDSDRIRETLKRSFQSAHINFLIGSGASLPAIPVAGNLEQEIANLAEAGQEEKARLKLYDFLANIQKPMKKLIKGRSNMDNEKTLKYYENYLGVMETILTERRTNLLPKQATVFTTNYDLFIEKASVSHPVLRLNDGFSRVPSLDSRMEYSSRNFFSTTYNAGNVYDYRVEIPCVNLIKLHGSLSWKKDRNDILFDIVPHSLLGRQKTDLKIQTFIDRYAVVLPQTTKFRTTLMDRTYYELLRIYANELDKENVLLVSFGFSFSDEHIYEITKRSLKNPTLKLLVFVFNHENEFEERFEGYNNVHIIVPQEDQEIDFDKFNQTLRNSLPKLTEKNER